MYPVAGLIRCWGSLRHKQFAASLNEQINNSGLTSASPRPLSCDALFPRVNYSPGRRECRSRNLSIDARGTTEKSWYLRALSGRSPMNSVSKRGDTQWFSTIASLSRADERCFFRISYAALSSDDPKGNFYPLTHKQHYTKLKTVLVWTTAVEWYF